MGKTHTVRFEPVGIEMEADEDETILTAAFRQGIMLMHGCKEGQCSACKSFLLDGEVDLDQLLDVRAAGLRGGGGLDAAVPGARLLRPRGRAHQLRRGGPARRHAAADGLRARRRRSRRSTHDITRLCLKRGATDEPFEFKPGQYVDIGIPGTTSEHRSFSMANLAAEAGELEFMIKRYEGGRFSGLLGDDGIKAGDTLEVTGPYGVFTLRASSPRRLVFIGGGAGMAPILCLLRSMAEAGVGASGDLLLRRAHRDRPLPPRRARGAGGRLPGFTFVPALSEAATATAGPARAGSSPTSSSASKATSTEVDAYLCGPPPMVDAAIAMLEAKGVPEAHIYFDKFTTTEHQ